MKEKEFDYVNEAYGLNLKKNCAVRHTKKNLRGQVAKGKGNYIYIRWDGEKNPTGPYHPTSDLEYPGESNDA